jgi:hypothetical protein
MLKMLGCGLQADKKTLTSTESHADRDAQFEYALSLSNRSCKNPQAQQVANVLPG